jgi:predicted transcriptional regulator
MSNDITEQSAPMARPDRRRRHADNPSVPISVNLPLKLKQRLDRVVIERRATRNAMISQALTMWLDAQERAIEADSAARGDSARRRADTSTL